MKKAIAMKCTPEQFDAIKDKLVGCEIKDNSNNSCNYLVNNFLGKENYIAPMGTTGEEKREVYKTWNEEIFLNACGIETERIFKGSELQVRHTIDGKWENAIANPNDDFRLKPTNLKKQELENKILEIEMKSKIKILELQNQLKQL